MMHKSKIQLFRSILRILERELGFQTDSESQCCGVTLSQCHIIMELNDNGAATIKGLSDVFGLDKSSLSRTVDKMVELGLLKREEDSEDRRFLKLSLSEKGNSTAEYINNLCNEYYDRLFSLIPKNKHETIIESMSILSEALHTLRAGSAKNQKGCCL